MGFANSLGLDFIQEVYATRVSVSKLLPGTDAVIELGGEDAKILFFTKLYKCFKIAEIFSEISTAC